MHAYLMTYVVDLPKMTQNFKSLASKPFHPVDVTVSGKPNTLKARKHEDCAYVQQHKSFETNAKTNP